VECYIRWPLSMNRRGDTCRAGTRSTLETLLQIQCVSLQHPLSHAEDQHNPLYPYCFRLGLATFNND
jgi:hypothetical protein